VKGDGVHAAPREVTLKDDLYVNTGDPHPNRLQGTRSPYYDKSRQRRVAHLPEGTQVLIKGLRHDRWWPLLESNSIFECCPVEMQSMEFDYLVGVDGRVNPEMFAW
jgi:hypothetical protein